MKKQKKIILGVLALALVVTTAFFGASDTFKGAMVRLQSDRLRLASPKKVVSPSLMSETKAPKPISYLPQPKIFFGSPRDFNPFIDGLNATASFNIWSINIDGSQAKPLTRLLHSDNMWPIVSPNKKKILFMSRRDLNPNVDSSIGAYNIWVMDADGTNQHPLTQDRNAENSAPRWSPDGTKIVYSSCRNLDLNIDACIDNNVGRQNIWVMDADGMNKKPLTINLHGSSAWSPAWSPDGTKIAFQSNHDLDPKNNESDGFTPTNIWIVNADGTNPHPLTTDNVRDPYNGYQGGENPNWSPDGTKIAFDSWRSFDPNGAPRCNNGQNIKVACAARNIWTINVDGTGLTALTKLTVSDTRSRMGQWSPDGNMIAFSSMRDLNPMVDVAMHSTNVWVMNADGTNQRAITRLRNNNNADRGLRITWSQDSHSLIFDEDMDLNPMIDASGPNNLWVAKVDGTMLKPITTLLKAANAYADL